MTTPQDLCRLGLRLADFALHDSVGDLLQVMQAQSMALEDTSELVGILRQRTRELDEAQQRAQEQTLAAQQAVRARTAFLATTSHEIRTPLNAIIGMTSLLLETPLGVEQRDYADTIRRSGNALLDIVNDILDISKIESGHLELEEAALDLDRVIEESLEIVGEAAARKQLELGYVLAQNTPSTLVGDGARLRQILVNLLANAVKFTERGQVTVHTEVAPGKSERLRISVIDTGIGIPRELHERVFLPFTQADADITRRYGGTGLGLAICKRLAEHMGGTLVLKSALGEGSSFCLELPLRTPATGSQRSPRALDGRRVLLFAMHPLLQQTLHGMLTRLGAVVTVPATLGDGRAPEVVVVDEGDLPILNTWSRTQPAAIRNARRVVLTNLHARDSAAPKGGRIGKPVRSPSLALAVLQEQSHGRTSGESPKPQSRTQRILVVEDNLTNQKVALLLLARMGYRADVACNGLEALAALERHSYSIILMDVQMPEMDGLEASREIRRRWGTHPVIIGLTAGAAAADREACLLAQMDDYLKKPIRLEQLRSTLESYETPVTLPSRREPAESSAPAASISEPERLASDAAE
jgi:signal transduction histidine kinase/FixJ family two-component response regulator